MKSMKFSHDYTKLNFDVFHTIRRNPWWAIGELLKINSPSKSFEAQVINTYVKLFGDLYHQFVIDDVTLEKDKFQPSYEDAVKFIENLLNRKITDKTIFIVYYLRKVKK